MEPFEAVLSSGQHSVCREHQGVEELEKEAFNRGLPEEERAGLAVNKQALSHHHKMSTDNLVPAASSASSPVILLIDDEKPFRAVIKQVLSKAGYEVVEAANGAEGINRFNDKPADKIITDIIMPEKEGIETIIELKNAHPRLKLIAMSGGGWYGTDIDFDMAQKLGARTLDKPFALQELLDLIDELLN